MTENEIATILIDVAYHVHKTIGPGLLESVYEAILAHDLRKKGLQVLCQVAIPVVYEGNHLEVGFRADLLINGLVIVELKSIEMLLPVHKKQLLTYLKLSGKRLGFLINFGGETFKGNIVRIVNSLDED
jgi:GxxExxY protein